MIIATNMAAMTVLNESNRQLRGANQASRELSLGERVTGAEDDASTYSISEKMKTKVKALDQAKANSANGQSMIDTASQAVDQQVNIMKLVKTIALKATDDTYNDSDRKILQKEVSQMLDQSEQIATTTNFNGIQLLDQSHFSRVDYIFDADAQYRVNPSDKPVVVSAPGVDTANAKPNEFPALLGDYVDMPSTVYDPTHLVAGNNIGDPPAIGTWVWNNRTSSMGQITGPDSNGDYFVDNDPTNPIDFDPPWGTRSSIAELVHPELSTPFNPHSISPGTMITTSQYPSYINSSTDFDNTGYEAMVKPGTSAAAGANAYFVPSPYSPNDGHSNVELDLSALAGKVPSPIASAADLDGVGFSLDCGACDQFVTIMFNAKSTTSTLYEGSSGFIPPMCYNIGIAGLDFTDSDTFLESLTQTIFNGISSANGASQTLPSATDTSTTVASHHNIQLNYIADTGKLTITKDEFPLILMNGVKGALEEHDFYKPEQLLALQTSDTSGQFNNIKLPNTTLSVLFPVNGDRWEIEPTPEDYPNPWPKEYHGLSDAEKKAKFKQEIWQYAVKSSAIDLNDCVTTREKANDFLERTDQAIKYLVNANTTLGAQYSRLDYTQDNLTTETENITAADSVLRDADMAKSATKLAKSNLLAQAAQSMLAQANQLPNKALEMLQG